MMNRNVRSALLAGTACLLLGVGSAVVLAEEKEAGFELGTLPAAVRATAEAHGEGAALTDAEWETEKGQQVYEIEVRKADGQELELKIAADGKLLGIEREDDDGDDEQEEEEKQISLSEAPAAIQSALARLLKDDATSVVLTREREGRDEVYEVEYRVDGVSVSLEFAANGAVLEQESQVDAASLPSEVTGAIGKKYPGAKIAGAEEVSVRFYELEIVTGGTKREVKVSPGGRLLDDDEDEEGKDRDDD